MNPYNVIKSRRVTEKARVLENLCNAKSNKCLKRCETPKVVFLVDVKATKTQIASAVEEIYKEQKVKVVKVNTACIPRKKKRVRGRSGNTARGKKAIVTLRAGDIIEDVGGN